MTRIPYLLSRSSEKTCRGWPKADAPQSETDGPERYIRVEMDVGVVLSRYGSTTEDNLWEGHRSYDILSSGCQVLKGWQSFHHKPLVFQGLACLLDHLGWSQGVGYCTLAAGCRA